MSVTHTKTLPRCPVEVTLSLIYDRWKVLIIRELLHGTRRFGEIRKSLGNVSTKVLTANLRSMEEDNLLTRQIYPEVPPRVEYTLTDLGYSLKPVMYSMVEWGTNYKKAMEGKMPFRIESGEILLITKAVHKDLNKIFALQAQVFSDISSESPASIKTIAELESKFGKGIFLTALNEKDEIIGAVGGLFGKDMLKISLIVVRPDYQGQEIGRKLLEDIETLCICSRYELSTEQHNSRVISLCDRGGYKKIKNENSEIFYEKIIELSNA